MLIQVSELHSKHAVEDIRKENALVLAGDFQAPQYILGN